MAHTTPRTEREDILRALELCDELGVDRFLEVHGYGPSKRYQLRHGGRSYPSKAIAGVAAGMTAREFSGGARHCVRVLRRLGFQVRDGERRGLCSRLRAVLARVAGAFPFAPHRAPALPVDPSCYFASGSSRVGDIRGLAAIGHDLGVAAPEVSAAAEAELVALAGTEVQVFVDSGAFSEVTFSAAGPVVVKPITDADWRRRLELYRRLAVALGDALHVVAPDRVGDQAVTLERLELYAGELRELDRLGARVLVPIQRGELSQAEFAARCRELLGFEFVPALPCMKAATSVVEAAAFARAYQPRQLHLLGIGTNGKAIAEYLEAVVAEAPACQLQLDSCVVRRLVGRTNGRKEHGGRRRVTFARDLVAELVAGADRQAAAVALALGGAL